MCRFYALAFKLLTIVCKLFLRSRERVRCRRGAGQLICSFGRLRSLFTTRIELKVYILKLDLPSDVTLSYRASYKSSYILFSSIMHIYLSKPFQLNAAALHQSSFVPQSALLELEKSATRRHRLQSENYKYNYGQSQNITSCCSDIFV